MTKDGSRVLVGVKAGFADIPPEYLDGLAADGTADFTEFSLCEDPLPDPSRYRSALPVGSVHAPHLSSNGFNPVDPRRRDHALRLLERCSAAADALGAPAIIVHPEKRTSPECSLEHLASVLDAWGDARCLVENMPCPGFFLVEPAEIRQFLEATGVGLCLDVAHAAGYAFLAGLDYAGYLAELAALGPRHWHASDTLRRLSPDEPDGYLDAHLTLGTGDIEWPAVLALLPAGAPVTLETPQGEGHRSDAALLRGNPSQAAG